MSGKVLFILLLLSVQAEVSQTKTCERRGPLNMTYVVNTLNQVINPNEPAVKSQNDVTKDVASCFTEETKQAIQNITDTLNEVVNSYGPPVNTENEVTQEVRRFRVETSQEIRNVTAVMNQVVRSIGHPVKSQEEIMEEVEGLTNETKQAMENVTDTLKKVVHSCLSTVKTREEVVEEIKSLTKKTQHSIQNITELLGRIVVDQEQLQREQEQLRHNNAQLQRDVTFIRTRITKSTCGDDAVCYSGSCYTTDVTHRTWDEARNNCRSKGGDLVTIETAGENAFLKLMMRKYSSLLTAERKKDGYFGFWTSGSDEEEEGTWKWMTTGSPVDLKNWKEGQPDNYMTQNHLVIMANQGLWDDRIKSSRVFSFCEQMLAC